MTDEIEKAIDKAIIEKWQNPHNEPSPKTLEVLATLTANYKNMDEKIEQNRIDNKDEHKEIKDLMIDGFKDLKEQLDIALDKKADKYIEKVMWWFLAIIGSGLITYVGSLLIKVIKL
jgi:hypothetical protein